MNERFSHPVESPVGILTLVSNGESLTGLYFGAARTRKGEAIPVERMLPLFREAVKELKAYFAGKLKAFSVPLAPAGTDFQLRAWQALRAIPYGETRSYGEIAKSIGRPLASRAVGMANNRNPIAIIVPCHRVIGADGSLTGFGGGLPAKKLLLALEAN